MEDDQLQAPADEPVSEEIVFTARELALIEDRDPNEVVEEAVDDAPEGDETPDGEVASAPADDAPPESTGPWYSDADRQYASQHGLSDWHLQQFESRAEFRKAAALLDATSARRPADSKANSASSAENEPPKKAEYVDKPVVDGKVNLEYYRRHKDEYEGADVILAMAENQAALEERLQAEAIRNEELQRQTQEQAQYAESQRQINAFHDTVDSVRPDFYGKSVDEFGNPAQLTKEQTARRETLFEEIYWLSQRIASEQQRKGLPVAIPSWSQLVKQAEPRAFGEEINRKTREKQLADAKAQARAIRPAAGSVGAGTARRAATTSDDSDDPKTLAQDPDLIAAYEGKSRR